MVSTPYFLLSVNPAFMIKWYPRYVWDLDKRPVILAFGVFPFLEAFTNMAYLSVVTTLTLSISATVSTPTLSLKPRSTAS